MGGLWTPSGEHVPEPDPSSHDAPPASQAPMADEEELEAVRRLHEELRAAPADAVIANHAVGLVQLAMLHLGLVAPPDRPPPPADLAKAGLAIDALACLVDGLGSRLGEHEEPLREALSQVQMAYVTISED